MRLPLFNESEMKDKLNNCSVCGHDVMNLESEMNVTEYVTSNVRCDKCGSYSPPLDLFFDNPLDLLCRWNDYMHNVAILWNNGKLRKTANFDESLING